MAESKSNEPPGPGFSKGVAFSDLKENEPCLGHFTGEPVVLVCKGDEVRFVPVSGKADVDFTVSCSLVLLVSKWRLNSNRITR